jgi:hypothetical protein
MADAYDSPQAHACPAFVRATPIAWEIVQSSTGEVIGETAGLREALDRVAKLLTEKPRVLHGESGEPDGEWRYLPAASAEDEPNEQDGVRLTERNIWQLAAGLNGKPQAIPIDGGPNSVVHGTAHDSATPANGWAHHGIVVYDASGRASLYLRAEMVPTVATMIDRGQLAFGSIHFFTTEPLDDTGAPEEAGLISYGLTNTPADQRITPASAVRAHPNHARSAVRTRQLLRAAPLATERSMDGVFPKKLWLEAINSASAKELSPEQLCEIVKGLAAQSAKPEDVAPDAPPTEEMQTAPPGEPPTRTDAPPVVEKRAVAGLEEPAALEAWVTAMLDFGRKVLGKPDADPAAVLTELQASQDKLAAALSSAPPTPTDGTPADQQGANALPPSPAQRSLDEEVTRCRTAFAKPTASPIELLAHARQTVERADHSTWLTKSIADRKLGVVEEDFTALLDDACARGRDAVTRTLNMLGRPPSGTVMRSEIAPVIGATADTLEDAVDACMELAVKQVPAGSPDHIVRAAAQKIARKHFPSVFSDSSQDAS